MAHQDYSVPCGRIRRSLPLARMTARAACGRIVAGLRERAGQEGAVERFHHSTAARYAELLGRSRGVLMKAGQILSMADTRAWGGGGLGPYLDALNRVQSDVPPMDPILVDELLKLEFGIGVEQFAEFSDESVAAASIGQVHRAAMTDGRQVAVKVQYPGVARAIRDDLANAELVETFLRIVMAATAAASGFRTDIRAVARIAGARIREETDYRHEASMMAAFGELYRDHPFIRIPQVVAESSGERVLTMTYLDGMDWSEAQHAEQRLKDAWAEAIMRFMYSNFRLSHLVHADPSPNNYVFFPDGTVGFLDFGCVQMLTDKERSGSIAMIRAAVDGRKADLRDLMARTGFLDAGSSLTAEDLSSWASELLYDVITAPQPVTYTPQIRTRVVRSMFDLRDRHYPNVRVNFPEAAIFAARIQLNLVSICTGLGATAPARAIIDDIDAVAEPITEMGKRHHAWVRARGLHLLPRSVRESGC